MIEFKILFKKFHVYENDLNPIKAMRSSSSSLFHLSRFLLRLQLVWLLFLGLFLFLLSSLIFSKSASASSSFFLEMGSGIWFDDSFCGVSFLTELLQARFDPFHFVNAFNFQGKSQILWCTRPLQWSKYASDDVKVALHVVQWKPCDNDEDFVFELFTSFSTIWTLPILSEKLS